jgi:prophage regulatory protein
MANMDTLQNSKRLSRLPVVLARVPLSRSQLYAEMEAGRFPRPIKISDRLNAWDDDEIDAWIAARIADREAA